MTSEIFCNHCGAANRTGALLCWSCNNPPDGQQATNPIQTASASTSSLLNRRYRLLDKLGDGGQGEVYRVEDTQLANRVLAAKKLLLTNATSARQLQETIDAFQREAHMLAGLKHPGLPEIYDYFEENSHYYLIMQFISGETLETRIEKLQPKQFPLVSILHIGIELAAVLDYLHTRTPPIIFRDLKPANIMLTPDERVYLIDFGIARHAKPAETKHTANLGTWGYISPEHLSLVTPLSDIYSLGAILHQLISGEDPTQRAPFDYPPLHLPGPAQTRLTDLVAHMLKKNVQERPTGALEVQQALQDIQNALQQTSAASTRQTAQRVKKHVQPPSPPKKRGEVYELYSHSAQTIHALAWSPDGQYLAAIGAEPAQIFVWDTTDGHPLAPAPDFKRPLQTLAWSPDSRLLALAGNEHIVRLWPPDGSCSNEYNGHTHWIQALAWSPDGQWIASGDANHQIHLWEVATGQQKLVYREHHNGIIALAWSPDGQWLASADDDGAVHVWESARGIPRTTYTAHEKTVTCLAWSPDSRLLVTGSEDMTLHIWEASTGQQSGHYTNHTRRINTVSWSAASKLIASASKDKTVHIWQPQSAQTSFIYNGHSTGVNALAWSPDGQRLASAGSEARIHIWQAV